MLISGSYTGFNEANLKQNRCRTQIPAQNILNRLTLNTPILYGTAARIFYGSDPANANP